MKDIERVSYKSNNSALEKERFRSKTNLSNPLGDLLWRERRPLPKFGQRQERLF